MSMDEPTTKPPKPVYIKVSATGEIRVTVDGVDVDADEFMETLRVATERAQGKDSEG
jgi:hypothetical protein